MRKLSNYLKKSSLLSCKLIFALQNITKLTSHQKHKLKLIHFRSSPNRNWMHFELHFSFVLIFYCTRVWVKWIWRAHSTTTIYIFFPIFIEHFSENSIGIKCCVSMEPGKNQLKIGKLKKNIKNCLAWNWNWALFITKVLDFLNYTRLFPIYTQK